MVLLETGVRSWFERKKNVVIVKTWTVEREQDVNSGFQCQSQMRLLIPTSLLISSPEYRVILSFSMINVSGKRRS